MSSPAVRDRSRRARTQQIENFARTYDLSVNPLNNGYQLRVENLVDLYPVNGRYCILQTGERGDFDTDNDLRQLMLRAIPDHMPHLVQEFPTYDAPPAKLFGEPITIKESDRVVLVFTHGRLRRFKNRIYNWLWMHKLLPGRLK